MDVKTSAMPEPTNQRPTPPLASRAAVEERMETADFWFLEVAWVETPMALLLVRRDDVERVGAFRMARNKWDKADWRTRGSHDVGSRDWDW